ncbi:MAG: hypothetical protein ABW165_16960 [Candidatus Thiodiazotropha sp.]
MLGKGLFIFCAPLGGFGDEVADDVFELLGHIGPHVAAVGVEEEAHFVVPLEALGEEEGADAGEDGADEIAEIAEPAYLVVGGVMDVGVVAGDGSGLAVLPTCCIKGKKSCHS